MLTDFLVRSFRRTVLAELGLDRYPELWPDYFGHYRRVVWLAQSRDPALAAEAEAVAARFGLPLTVIDTGTARLERELELLLAASPAARRLPAPAAPPQRSPPSRYRTRSLRAGSPPAPLPSSAPPTTAGAAGGVVIRRLVAPGQHQSFDHERGPTDAATAGDPTGHSGPASPRKSRCRGGAVRGGLTSAAALLAQPRYEVFPSGSVEQAVADWVPPGMTVTVTASPARGWTPRWT